MDHHAPTGQQAATHPRSRPGHERGGEYRAESQCRTEQPVAEPVHTEHVLGEHHQQRVHRTGQQPQASNGQHARRQTPVCPDVPDARHQTAENALPERVAHESRHADAHEDDQHHEVAPGVE